MPNPPQTPARRRPAKGKRRANPPSATSGSAVAAKRRIRAEGNTHITPFDVFPGWLCRDTQSRMKKGESVPMTAVTHLRDHEVVSLDIDGRKADYQFLQQPGALSDRGIFAPLEPTDPRHYYYMKIQTVDTVFGPKSPKKAYLIPYTPQIQQELEAAAHAPEPRMRVAPRSPVKFDMPALPKVNPKARTKAPLSPSRFNVATADIPASPKSRSPRRRGGFFDGNPLRPQREIPPQPHFK